MQLSNNYWYFKSAIDKDTCRKIVNYGKSIIQENLNNGYNVEATTFGNAEKSANPNAIPQADKTAKDLAENKITNTYLRDSSVAWINENWLYDILVPYIDIANNSAGWNWQISNTESCQFTVYNKQGFYGWHRDGMSDNPGAYKRYIYGVTDEPLKNNGDIPDGYTQFPEMVGKVRKISMTVNLTDPADYQGGDLKFDFGEHAKDGERFHICEEIRPQGSIIVFPSFLPHCVTPVTSGTRYSAVLWALGEPFK